MADAGLTEQVRRAAFAVGFTSVGIATVERLEASRLEEWLDRGFQGEMSYMERNTRKRLDPTLILESARTILSLTLEYTPSYRQPYEDSRQGVLSKYALGTDYHFVLKDKMAQLLTEIGKFEPGVEGRYYVDTGPVMDKVWASRAGLGWIGKHTNLIDQKRGSWFFIGEILLNLDLVPDAPVEDRCGSCTRCLEVCPTDAIVEEYVLDARRCLSYLNIELRDAIPHEFREAMGNLIFGCDLCQDVCPWNRRSSPVDLTEFAEPGRRYDLKYLARLTPEEFSRLFSKSPVKRTKWRGFMRNVAIAMGNSGSDEFIPELEHLARAGDPLVREHALWGLAAIGSQDSLRRLRVLESED